MQANHFDALAAPGPARAQRLGQSWLRQMRAGNFEAAWRVSDEVLELRRGKGCAHLPRHLQWVWNGESLADKRVLIRSYHGLGDTIQFIRYAPLVREIAKEVTVWAQPELLPLLRTMHDAFDELLPLHDGAPDCEFDVDVELMELPHVFRTSLATIPAEVPYFQLEPERLSQEDKLNAGLVWSAGEWDPRRCIPFDLVRKLGCAPGVNWHILQRGAALKDWDNAFGVNAGSDDALRAARVIAGFDLLISVDTFAAHLGGALGAPTWTLLRDEPDWRWMIGRDDSPWYPTMRLFRQPSADDWQSVIESVLDALRTITTTSLGSGSPELHSGRA